MTSTREDFLTATQAVEMLGIQKQTLYSYVSRGFVRSIASGSSRGRRYSREDLERIQARAKAHFSPDALAASTLNLGHPVVPTSVTEITAEGPRYRGQLATDLARQGATFEQVADLLWTGLWHENERPWSRVRAPKHLDAWLSRLPRSTGREQLIELFALVVMHLAMGRGPLEDRLISGRPLDAAREVIISLVGCFGLLSSAGTYRTVEPGTPVAGALLQALGRLASPGDCRLLDATLVLLADHELSPGAFSARIAASSGSSMHSCIAAAITTSSGLEIARRYDRIEKFLSSAPREPDLMGRAAAQLQSGQDVPGFGHPMYPNGDPRAAFLLAQVAARKNTPAGVKHVLSFIEKMRTHHGLQPRHELAVLAVCRSLKLPKETPSALFVLARVAGWVAHVLEQRLTSTMIRPRARFVANAASERSPDPLGVLGSPHDPGAGRDQLDPEPLERARERVPGAEAGGGGRMAHLVRGLARGFLRSLQLRLASQGVALGHWQFLRILWEKDGLTQRELSAKAGVMQSTTVVALRAMEGLGYISRERHGDNKKNSYVFLTTEGRRLQDSLVPFAEEVNALAVRGFAAAQVEMTRQSLHAMLINLSSDPLVSTAGDDAPELPS